MYRKTSAHWHPHTLIPMHVRTQGCMLTFEPARARKHPPVSLALVTLSFSLSFFVCPATTSRSAERACEIIIWPSDQDGFSRDNRKSSSSNDRCSWQYLATDKGRRRRPLRPGPGCTSLSYSLSRVKVAVTPVGALQCTGTLANNLCNLSLGVSLQWLHVCHRIDDVRCQMIQYICLNKGSSKVPTPSDRCTQFNLLQA